MTMIFFKPLGPALLVIPTGPVAVVSGKQFHQLDQQELLGLALEE